MTLEFNLDRFLVGISLHIWGGVCVNKLDYKVYTRCVNKEEVEYVMSDLATIAVKRKTLEQLRKLGRYGDSMDRIIQRLLNGVRRGMTEN